MSSNRFYSSNFQKPTSSPQSQPENVKTVEQEAKQHFDLPLAKAVKEAGTWTKVLKGKQTTRKGLRNEAVLNFDKKKYSTPSPPLDVLVQFLCLLKGKQASLSFQRPKPKLKKIRAKNILLPFKLK